MQRNKQETHRMEEEEEDNHLDSLGDNNEPNILKHCLEDVEGCFDLIFALDSRGCYLFNFPRFYFSLKTKESWILHLHRQN